MVYQKGNINLIVMTIILFTLVVGGLLYLKKPSGNFVSPSQQNIAVSTPIPTPLPSMITQPNQWKKSYTSTLLHLTFKLPDNLSSLGDLDEQTTIGSSGKEICALFPKGGKEILFSICETSVDFDAPRDGDINNIQGFQTKNGNYYAKSANNLIEIPQDVITEPPVHFGGIDYLVLSRKIPMQPTSIWNFDGYIALGNINNPTYPGIVVSLSPNSHVILDEFEFILSTFQFSQ